MYCEGARILFNQNPLVVIYYVPNRFMISSYVVMDVEVHVYSGASTFDGKSLGVVWNGTVESDYTQRFII